MRQRPDLVVLPLASLYKNYLLGLLVSLAGAGEGMDWGYSPIFCHWERNREKVALSLVSSILGVKWQKGP